MRVRLPPPFTRKRGETVEVWLKRSNYEECIHIQNSTIIDTYNTARYSNGENNVDMPKFKEEVHQLYALQKDWKRRKRKNNSV